MLWVLISLSTLASAPTHALVGSFSTFQYLASSALGPQQAAVQLEYQRGNDHWMLGAGARVVISSRNVRVPLEVFGHLRMRGVWGRWEPALGPELGWSAGTGLSRSTVVPSD